MDFYSHSLNEVEEYEKIIEYLNTKQFRLQTNKYIDLLHREVKNLGLKDENDFDYVENVLRIERLQTLLREHEGKAFTFTQHNGLVAFSYHEAVRNNCITEIRNYRVSLDFAYCLPGIISILVQDQKLSNIDYWKELMEPSPYAKNIRDALAICVNGQLTNRHFNRIITDLSFKNPNLDKYIKTSVITSDRPIGRNHTATYKILNDEITIIDPTFQEAFLTPITYLLSKLTKTAIPRIKASLGKGNGVVKSLNLFEAVFDVLDPTPLLETPIYLNGIKLEPKVEVLVSP